MNGWLIVNGFLKSEKFDDIYHLLADAFRAKGVGLAMFPNTAFATPVGMPPLPAGVATPPDFVLFWDKDVSLAHRFEDAGMSVANSAAAIACCDDKILTARAFARHGIPVPKTIVAPKTFEGVGYCDMGFLRAAAGSLGFPMVIKEACGSFGRQVYLANDIAGAERIVRSIGHKDFLMQEFVASSRGRDLRVNVVGGEVVASMRRFNDSDFRSNVTLGGGTEPATPTRSQRDAAIAACRAVGADFAGVDILYGPGGEPLVCEINTNPHFRSTLECTGVNLADSIAAYILRRRQVRAVRCAAVARPADARMR